jgi:hypothetical protein
MKTEQIQFEGRNSFWQFVFLQSRVNGAPYRGEQLPLRPWNWPRNTYLQQRLKVARALESGAPGEIH